MNFKKSNKNDHFSYDKVFEGAISNYLPGRPQSEDYRDWKTFVDKQLHDFHNGLAADQLARFAQQLFYLHEDNLHFLYKLKLEFLWRLIETIDQLRDSDKAEVLMGIFKKVIAILKSEDSWKLVLELAAKPKYRKLIYGLLKDLLDQDFSYRALKDVQKLCFDHSLSEEAAFGDILITRDRIRTHVTLLKHLIYKPNELNHAIRLFKKVEKETYKLLITWIKEANLNLKDYEFLIGNSRFETMYYYLKDFNWGIVEEMISNSTDLAVFLNHLIQKNRIKEAYSVWHRLSKHHKIHPPAELKASITISTMLRIPWSLLIGFGLPRLT